MVSGSVGPAPVSAAQLSAHQAVPRRHPCPQNKLFGNLGLGQACTVQLEFRAPEGGALETVTPRAGAAAGRRDGDSEAPLPLFSNHGRVAGEVKVTPVPGRRVEHQGVRVQLVGEIELAAERGHPHEFLSLGEGRGWGG